MRAFVGTSLGSIDGFVLDHLPVPEPGAGQIRIRVQATALGFVDGLIVQGRYQLKPVLPYIPGGEIAGVVDATGPGAESLKQGQGVVTWQLGGGLAEYAVVNLSDVDVVQDDISAVVAASMLVDYQTAHHALFEVAAVRAGDSVLVLGAAGGVGSAAVQMAAWGRDPASAEPRSNQRASCTTLPVFYGASRLSEGAGDRSLRARPLP